MKAELAYLLARKSKIPKQQDDAANLLTNAGLASYIRMLDRIKEEELDEKIEILDTLIAHEEKSAFKKRKIEQQGSGGMDVPILIISSSQ